MTYERGKLALPNTDTCRFRGDVSRTADTEDAVCGLIATLVPALGAEACRIRREVCDACCRSFPPSIDTLNPVVASVSYDLATRVLDAADVNRAEFESAQRLKLLAERSLDTITGGEASLIPGRARDRCGFLGSPRDQDLPEPGFDCSHPSHGTTTLAHCRTCPDWSRTIPISTELSVDELLPRFAPRSGPRVTRWAVGVTTAPRRQSTLEWCLDSMAHAGWPSPHLFLDGTVRVPDRFSQLAITWHEKRLGAWPNYFLALCELLMLEPDADAYLLVQDDAIVFDRNNVRDYLERTLWPGTRQGIVSLYCPEIYNNARLGWQRLEQSWLWGALCFVFPVDLARAFVSDSQVARHRWKNRDAGQMGIDNLIGEWARTHDVDIWYPIPSLVQHAGNVSAIWHEADNSGPRRADWFARDIESPFAAGTSFDEFPESAFVCEDRLRDDYEAKVATGRRRMREASLVVCGLCRDVRQYLPRFAARVERLGTMFRDYHVVLFENDSNDGTLAFLSDWKRRNPRIHVLSDRLGAPRFGQIRSDQRATQLAGYRNRCREYAVATFPAADFLIVADTDLAGGWSFDGIASTFGCQTWDFVGSNGLMMRRFVVPGRQANYIQFDAWAFRKTGHPGPHSNDEINDQVFYRGEPMVSVWSCFGGVGIYRMEAVRDIEYGGPDCEHVVLHQRMRQRGFDRLYLNPSQIVLYTNSSAPLP